MSDVTKCDRCGEIFDNEMINCIRYEKTFYKINGRIATFLKGEKFTYDKKRINDYDLCSKCFEEFEAFMKINEER